MTEITEDRDFKTNINVESQTINYIKNPEKFKEDLQIAIIEGKATGRTVVKTIDNVINGDKSQDIGDAERRSLIEIKEAIVRVQTAPAMDIIAEKDLADKNVQKELGVVIEKFDPNDPTLSEKVRERIDELKAEGKELVAFYDKVTKKIFINQNAKDEEVRASIAREYKIKEDLKLGRGKENDKGQLRSTVAGEIAYDEIKDRLKKGDKNPISASSFDVAKMDKDSEVTSDGYFEEAEVVFKKAGASSSYGKLYEELEESGKSPEEKNRVLAKADKDLKLKFGEIDKKYQEALEEEATARKRAVLIKKKLENSTDYYEQEYYKSYYDHLIRKSNPKKAFFKSAGKGAIKGVATMVLFEMTGLIPKSEPNITIPKSSKFYKDTRYPISAEDLYVISVNDPEYYKDNSHLYKVTGELNPKAGLYNKKIEDPVILKHMTEYHNNTLTNNEKLGDGLGNLIGYIGYVGANKLLNRLDAHIYKNSNSSLVSANKITNEEQLLLENKVNSVQRNVYINNVKTGETTKAYQNITTYPDGSMSISQKNLTTGEISFQGINSSGQRVFETSLTPHEANTLIGANSSSKMLVGNGAVSQSVISNRALATVPLLTDGAVSQVASKLPYNPVLKSPVKYPNLTDSENKFLNDYMNKEMPGKIVSKYNDVNKYEYNATTNPGPLSIGDDPPINNFYGGMYNDASNESGIFVRMGDKIKPYGSWYTKVSKNSEVEARVDLAIKKWWVDSNGEIKIRGLEAEKSILDTMYYIEFPEGIPKYKGPVGYQGGPFLGGLDQEQYFIPNSRNFGKVIKSHPIK